MCGIGVRMKQAHRHDVHLVVVQHPRQLIHVVFHDRFKHSACGVQAFRDAKRQMRLHQGRPRCDEDVVQLRPRLPADLQDILEPPGRDQRNLGAFPLQHSVRGHSRPMHNLEVQGSRSPGVLGSVRGSRVQGSETVKNRP